jgi:hypothetical protein
MQKKGLWQLQLSFVSSFEPSLMNFPPNTKIAAYWCHPHFSKVVKTTPQPLIYSTQNTKLRETDTSRIKSNIGHPLLASIHPPTRAKKKKLKKKSTVEKFHKLSSLDDTHSSRSWKKANNTHPRNLHHKVTSAVARLWTLRNALLTQMSITLMQETLSMKSRWVEAGRKSAVKSSAPQLYH